MVKDNLFFNLLVEGTRDKVFQKYADLLAKKGVEVTASQLKDYMRKKLTTEAGINALSLPSSYFLSGATKLYFNGELTTNKRLSILYPKLNIKDKFDFVKCKKLNKIIIDLRNMYIDSEGQKWDVPEDFGELSLDEIIKKYKKFLKGEIFGDEPEKEDAPIDTRVGNYTFDILYNHKIAEKYGPYTIPYQWCITQAGNDHWYNRYQRDNGTHFVVFRRNGFENEKQIVDNSKYPLDKYGTSLLAAQLKNKDGSFYCCTTRWNHGSYANQNGEAPYIPDADFAVSWEQFQQITGCTKEKLNEIQKEWLKNQTDYEQKPKVKEDLLMLRKLKYAAICINNGQNPVIPGHEMFSEINTVMGTAKNEKWNKGIKVATMRDNYKRYSAILDNGKLKPNTFFKDNCGTTLYNNIYQFSTSTSKKDEYKDLLSNYIYLRYKGYSDNKFRLYDIKKHSLVSIAGKTLFDNQYGINDYKYFFIKLGTKQYSIFNLETGDTLKADDGTDVFEYMLGFNYSSCYQIREKYDIGKNLFLVGDSANHKCYLYINSSKKIITPPTMENGKIAMPITNSSSCELNGSEFYIAANNPVPKERYRGTFSNVEGGTFLFSKENNNEITPFGLQNPVYCLYDKNFEAVGYLRGEIRRNWIVYIKQTKKFLNLKDDLHLFQELRHSYGNFIELYPKEKESYFSPENFILCDGIDGRTLTKNGLTDNGDYDLVRRLYSCRIDNFYEINFEDGTQKLFDNEKKTFVRFENGEDSFTDITIPYDNNKPVKVVTVNGETLSYENKTEFLNSLMQTSQINERFEKLVNYKLMHF